MTTVIDSLLRPGPMVDTTIPKPIDPKKNGAAATAPGVAPTEAQPANVVPPMGNTGKPFTLKVTSIDELLTRDWPETPWLVNGLIPQGLILLAGKAKLGKSWLCLQLAQAVATGGMFLGVKVDQAPVLYLALEDNSRRIAQRAKLQGWAVGRGRCDFVHLQDVQSLYPLCKRTADRLAEVIEASGYKLVVIDTLSRLYKGDQNDVGAATEALSSLQSMAMRAGAAVILVDHHNKVKQNEETLDPVTDVLGSTGKGAVADAIMGLYRIEGQPGAILALTGRDVEESRLALVFDKDTHTWQDTGMDYRTLRLSDARRAVLDAVADMGQATCQEVADALGQDKSNVHKTLSALLREGFLAKSGQTYHLAQDDDERDTTTTTSTTTTTGTTSTTTDQNAGGRSGSGGTVVSGSESTTADAPPPGLDLGKRALKVSASRVQELVDEGYTRADALALANAEQAPTAPTGAPDADALADAVLSVRPLVAMLSSGPMQLDVFGEFAINNHARPDLVEAAALECGAMIYECDGVRWVALA